MRRKCPKLRFMDGSTIVIEHLFERDRMMMRKLLALGLAGLLSCSVVAGEHSVAGLDASNEMLVADNRRQERRGGRQDNRDDKQDCRQEEGRVGDDKRECKQDARGEGDDKAETDGAKA